VTIAYRVFAVQQFARAFSTNAIPMAHPTRHRRGTNLLCLRRLGISPCITDTRRASGLALLHLSMEAAMIIQQKHIQQATAGIFGAIGLSCSTRKEHHQKVLHQSMLSLVPPLYNPHSSTRESRRRGLEASWRMPPAHLSPRVALHCMFASALEKRLLGFFSCSTYIDELS
jgi:hypothetical protein